MAVLVERERELAALKRHGTAALNGGEGYNGFYQYRVAGDQLIMSDLRIGFSPSFVFSFEVARRIEGQFRNVNPVRVRMDTPRSEGVKQLLAQVVDTLKTCG